MSHLSRFDRIHLAGLTIAVALWATWPDPIPVDCLRYSLIPDLYVEPIVYLVMVAAALLAIVLMWSGLLGWTRIQQMTRAWIVGWWGAVTVAQLSLDVSEGWLTSGLVAWLSYYQRR